MNTLTTLEMRNELGKRGVTIARVACGAPFGGFVFEASAKWIRMPYRGNDIVALTRWLHRRTVCA